MKLALSACAKALTIAAVASLGTAGCDEGQRNVDLERMLQRAFSAATTAETQARTNFLGIWPSAWTGSGWSYSEQGRLFTGETSVAALVEDRYVLKLIFAWGVPADLQRFKSSNLRYHFYEIDSVRLPPDGGKQGGQFIAFNPTNQAWFGPNEWNKLVASKWDFSVIGVHIVSNSPVPNIRTLAPSRW